MADKPVPITFNVSTSAVSTPSDVTITKKGKSKIEFDLTTTGLPQGASAKIVGVEFPTTGGKTQPSGTGFTPGSVFEDSHTITVGGTAVTIYGKEKSGSAKDLILTDDDEVPAAGPDEDYPYKVWVALTNSAGATTYFASPDPQIKNKPGG